jgi:DNA-binding NarL/FixJ family response regulator
VTDLAVDGHAEVVIPDVEQSAEGVPGRRDVSMTRVLIVDDHPLVRDSLTDLFAATDDLTVVGQCADGSEVVEAVERTGPHVVVMDLQMPRVDGLTAARSVLAAHPRVRIVFLSGGLTPASAREASEIGAAGYLLKEDDPAALPGHIRAVAAGETVWHPRALALLQHNPDLMAGLPLQALPSTYVEACPPRLHQL